MCGHGRDPSPQIGCCIMDVREEGPAVWLEACDGSHRPQRVHREAIESVEAKKGGPGTYVSCSARGRGPSRSTAG